MTTSSTPDQESAGTGTAEQLREALIDRLRSLSAIRTDAVCAAVRAVLRHLFMPEAPLSQAYAAEEAFITKKDADGVALSSVSAARIQAFMLEQAAVRPGMRVLEIGSGGLNAAYLAELVGEQGEVTSIDIDPDVVARARRLLDGAGYERVRVCVADGEEGEPRHAPYDRILVTVGAWDIPPAWSDQLARGGRNDVDMVAYYAPHMRPDSLDGKTITGSAYGARMFKPVAGDTISPFDRALELLRTEADSKRGVLPIFEGGELAVDGNPDVSCVVALHLLVREDRLHMVCYMRANDCDRGLLADIFCFTLIQEFTAAQLGLDLGTDSHHIGSAHIGDRDFDRVQRVLEEATARRDSPAARFPSRPMPTDTTFDTLATVLWHEEALRTNQVQYPPRHRQRRADFGPLRVRHVGGIPRTPVRPVRGVPVQMREAIARQGIRVGLPRRRNASLRHRASCCSWISTPTSCAGGPAFMP